MDELKELRQLLVEAAEDLACDVHRTHIRVRLTLDQIGGLLAKFDQTDSAHIAEALIRLDALYREQQDEPCERPSWLAIAHHDAEAILATRAA